MPDVRTEVLSNNMLRIRTQWLTLLNNLLAAIEENYREYAQRMITAEFEKMEALEIPWEEKLLRVQMLVMTDSKLDDATKTAINEIITKEFNKQNAREENGKSALSAEQGLSELSRMFHKSGLSKTDKQIVEKIIQRAKYEMHDPHSLTVDRSAYSMMVKLLNETQLMSQVTAIQLVSGDYMFLYSSGVESRMQNLAETVSLYQGRLPRPELEDIETYAVMTEETRGQSNIIKFAGLSPELAEKAVMESTKTRSFSFAKKVREDGKVDIYCYGGDTKDDKKMRYKEAVQTIAFAAYSLTGNTKTVEDARARHSASEYARIQNVLECISNGKEDVEDSGYVYSVIPEEINGNRYIRTDDYVKFSPESFTTHFNGNETTYHENDSAHFLKQLRLNIQSGAGTKVYISDNQMEKLTEKAREVYQLINNLESVNRLDQIAELINQKNELLEQMQTNKRNKMLTQNLREKIDIMNIAQDALQIDMRSPITPDICLQRTIGSELASHEFKGRVSKSITKEMLEEATVCNKAIGRYLRKDMEYDFDPEHPDINDITTVLSHANFTSFIKEETDRAQAVDISKEPDPNIFTVEDAKKELKILNTHFSGRCAQAAHMLQDIEVSIEHASADKTQQQNHINSLNLHQKFQQKLRKALGTEKSVKPEQSETRNEHKALNKSQTVDLEK